MVAAELVVLCWEYSLSLLGLYCGKPSDIHLLLHAN